MNPNIYISYSPEDSELVAAIVARLCASCPALVYRDADSLRTGKSWQAELATAIAHADLLVLFWCQHASICYEVRKEFAAALEQGKEVIPLLLDGTPLPAKLAAFRAIDFRTRAARLHAGSTDSGAQAEVDSVIAADMSRQYEELLVLSLAREIETELAVRLGQR